MDNNWPKHLTRPGKEDFGMSPAVERVTGDTIALNKMLIVPTFPFLKLPPELRVMIYKPLIQDGDLNILRVSKLINHEAVPLLTKVGVFRITLGLPANGQITFALIAKVTLPDFISLTASNYIQHLDLCLDMSRYRKYFMGTRIMQLFAGNEVVRETCRVIIKFGPLAPIPRRPEDKDAYQKISALTGFKTLRLILVYHRDLTHEASMRNEYGVIPFHGDYTRPHSKIVRDYIRVREYLKVTLGPANFYDTTDGRCLKFRPRAYRLQE